MQNFGEISVGGQKQNAFVLLKICLARQWDVPTASHCKNRIKNRNKQETSRIFKATAQNTTVNELKEAPKVWSL
jgi:hypothetical protein